MPGDESPEPVPPYLVQILTTEQFVLQAARSSATAESSSRSATFLTVLSATVVALSLVAQVSGREELLPVFAALGLPVVLLVGIATYTRALQNGIEDFLYVRGINRIRHAYTELAPQSAPYFVLSIHDDAAGVMGSMGLRPSPRQFLFTTASLISLINSLVAGVLVGLMLGWLGEMPHVFAGLLGGVTTLGTAAGFLLHQRWRWLQQERDFEVKYPSPPPEGGDA